MKRTEAMADQFEWEGDNLIHRPTNARFWWSYPNSDSDNIGINWGNAGDRLENGEDYDRENVESVAFALLAKKRRQKRT